ncbi:MAG TPA: YceI family protein [Bryobacteraceae bacterium]|nr:YceI family protein [Bryobacteraceae bacterium]
MMLSAWNFLCNSLNRLDKNVLAVLAVSFSLTAAASAQPQSIDTGKSTLTVRVYKAGVFSALGHNHEIAAPITQGAVDTSARRVELEVRASALQVRDPDASDKDREQIQYTMLGPEVLDAQRYREITFRSTDVEPTGPDAWNVRGNLMLHGETHIVTVQVRQANGHYIGSSRFKQSDFGIKPVKVAGGTIRVKDEVQIGFDIQLAS